MHKSVSSIDSFGENLLRTGKIIDSNESPFDMVRRITENLIDIDEKFGHLDTRGFTNSMIVDIGTGKVIPNTAIMTNLGRHSEKPLSACTVPDINLQGDLQKIKVLVDNLHLEGMGTGFNFDGLENPIEVLRFLNKISVDLQSSGVQERPVGNMGVISVYNKNILDFINIKRGSDKRGEKWNFNLSISVNNAFMLAATTNKNIVLSDGISINASWLLDQIAESAHECADPGILFMERMQLGNTTPNVGTYESVAPCGETGLTKGETCVFASVNLAEFVTQDGKIDYQELSRVISNLVRYLDNIIEYNLDRYIDHSSKYIMSMKRKIGIGVCGVADMLIKLNLPYGGIKSVELITDIMSYLNYQSKQASVTLAKKRGPFQAFKGSLYMSDYIKNRYSSLPTNTISSSQWSQLNEDIKIYGIRNSNTIILPPTGRSSLIFGTSQQIEPIFSVISMNGSVHRGLSYLPKYTQQEIINTGSLLKLTSETVTHTMRKNFRTAKEISIGEHMEILAAFQLFTDESVSKTINLPSDCSLNDIRKVYTDAYKRGFKGITIYRDGSRLNQPIKL